MKRNKNLTAAVALLLCAAMLFAGCGSAASNLSAADVGDGKVTVQQLQSAYNNASAYASYYGYDTTTEEGRQQFTEYLLDSLVRETLLAYEARQAGMTLTAEETAQAKETAKKSYDDLYAQYKSYAEQQGATDVEAYANKYLTEALLANGSTVQKLKDDYLRTAEDDLLVAKHKEQLLADKQPTAEDLQKAYDDELAAQKETFTSSPASFFTYQSYFSYGYTYMPLYVPDGFFRVRHILVADEATAQEVLDKLSAGGDFETLLKEYNTDPGMESEENAAGYLVGTGANFNEEFLTAALALEKDGDLSPIVKSDNGYHIIKRVSTEKEHEVPYADVQTTFDTMAKNNILTTAYEEIVTGWLDSGVVTKHTENYESLYKEA